MKVLDLNWHLRNFWEVELKFNRSDIEKIIKEELNRSSKELVTEILGSTSKIEIKELLKVHFKELGKIPQDITRLSVLFPVLEKAGLGDVVDAFIEKAESEGKDAAYVILEPVRDAIISIKQETGSK